MVGIGEDLNCCISNDIITNLKESLGITETITFEGIGSSGSTECDMLYNDEIESKDKQYKLKCFKYGRLGILKVNQ